MKQLALLALCLSLSFVANAAAEDHADPPRKKVGLVLSGGGAKGVAHIRVIKVLEEAGIPIDYIAGTSMGAIVGGLYAIGYTTDELDSLVRNQDWIALLSDKIARNDKLFLEKESSDTYVASVQWSLKKKFKLPTSVLSGESVLNLLTDMTIGYHDQETCFDSLPIPFACVSYDMVEGKQYVARSGSLPRAIRASMSIPGAFTPISLDSMYLVDGGIYNNFPTDVAREMGADIIIGVDLFGGKKNKEELQSIMGMIDQVTTFLGRDKYAQNLKNVDLYLHPDITPYNSASFTPAAIDTLLARGERVARENWDAIVALKRKIGIPENFRPDPVVRHTTPNDSIRIDNITFVGLTRNEENSIRRQFRLSEKSAITRRQLNNAIDQLRGSGAFSYVSYTLRSSEPYDLTIYVNEKEPITTNIGFRFDSESTAAILLNTTFMSRGIFGPSLSITGRLSDNPYGKLEFSSRQILRGSLGFSYTYRYNDFKIFDSGRKVANASFGQNVLELNFSNLRLKSFDIVAGVQFERFSEGTFFANDPSTIPASNNHINYRVVGSCETFNDRYYPTRGFQITLGYTLYTDNGLLVDNRTPLNAIQYDLRTALSVNTRFTILPSLYGRTLMGDRMILQYQNCMGGEIPGRYLAQQMPFIGIRHIQFFDDSIMAGKLDLRMRLWKNQYITLGGNIVTQNNDFINMFTQGRWIWGVGLKYSFNTPVGPISLQVDKSSDSSGVGCYFSFGKFF